MAQVSSDVEARRQIMDLLDEWRRNRQHVDRLDRWYRGRNDLPSRPRHASREYRDLLDRSSTPWLKLGVTAVAQALYVDGYRRADSSDDQAGWDAWQANGMDARQLAVHRGALAHGLSYVTALPGELDSGEDMPEFRGVSARRMVAFYTDPASDEWPEFALSGDRVDNRGNPTRLQLWDDQSVWSYTLAPGGSLPKPDGEENVLEHEAGRCPVVRYTNMLDLDGRTEGEVEPYIPLAARIDQDTFDRLVVQRFGAWVVRTISGMVRPETDEEAQAAKIRLAIENILVSESPDTKFGTLQGTPLEGFIKSREADIRDFAAATQTPPHHLTGEMVNMSAEALAAAEALWNRKVTERKHSFGESHEQLLRFGQHLRGDEAGAADFAAQVKWRDMESRSLAQAADALGKMAQMLRVPVEVLWEKLPGFTQQDVERMRELAQDSDAFGQLVDQLSKDLAAVPAA